ncbi:MAG: hypothetical protein HOY79_46970 [Streptomyces sp.]|nr:hypothetical protein [Streptomyces sp.]
MTARPRRSVGDKSGTATRPWREKAAAHSSGALFGGQQPAQVRRRQLQDGNPAVA